MKPFRMLKDVLASSRQPKLPPIEVHENGFQVDGRDVLWSAITEIVGYKADLITSDEVRFRFTHSLGQVLECGEDQPGFAALASEVVARFPSASGWQHQLLSPAFAPNTTTLYKQP